MPASPNRGHQRPAPTRRHAALLVHARVHQTRGAVRWDAAQRGVRRTGRDRYSVGGCAEVRWGRRCQSCCRLHRRIIARALSLSFSRRSPLSSICSFLLLVIFSLSPLSLLFSLALFSLSFTSYRMQPIGCSGSVESRDRCIPMMRW